MRSTRMTTTHLACAGGSLAAQAIAASMMQRTLPHVADAQAALFFGVACTVTVLGNACVQVIKKLVLMLR